MQWKFFAMFDEKKKIKNLNLRLIFCMLLIFRYTHVSYIRAVQFWCTAKTCIGLVGTY